MVVFKSIIFLILVILNYGNCTSLFKIDGQVAAEDYNYYKIAQNGNLLLVLETLEGDADLYVTEKPNVPPTFEPDTYDFQSSTCGTDSIYITKNFKRPFTVGVYGHFSFNQSKYSLDVHQMPDTTDYFEEETTIDENLVVDKQPETDNDEKTARKTLKIKKKAKNLPNSLWPFLELFEIIFL